MLIKWIVGIALLGGTIYWSVPVGRISAAQLEATSAAFSFNRVPLEFATKPVESRPVFTQAFAHVEYFLSGFAPAGVALADLDGNGLSDEACTTDVLTSRVTIHPVPGRQAPFAPFDLDLTAVGRPLPHARPSGCLPGDFNEDGTVDLLVYFWGATPVIFNRDSSRPLSKEAFKAESLLRDDAGNTRWYTQAMLRADVDGDGRLDLVVANYFADNGAILNGTTSGPSEMNGGWGDATNGAKNRILLAQNPVGGVNFVEAKNVFPETEWTIALGAADLNGDQLPEIIFVNDHGPDRVMRNRSKPGNLQFEYMVAPRSIDVAKSKTLGHDNFHGMGIDFGDLNRDGRLDWFVSNWTSEYLIQQSNFAWISTGDAQRPFVDYAEDLGLARTVGVPWDVRIADFNNDGSPEIVQSTGFMRGQVNRVPEFHELALFNDQVVKFPEAWHHFSDDDEFGGQSFNGFYTKGQAGRYVDIGSSLSMFEEEVSRGIVVADVDGDGRLDMLVGVQRSAPMFYHNQSKSTGAFLSLVLSLPFTASKPEDIRIYKGTPGAASLPPGRIAIGANVTVTLPSGERIAATVDGGSGFAGRPDGTIHLGLGALASEAKLKVTVAWRGVDGRLFTDDVELTPGRYTLGLGSNSEFAEVRP